MTCKVRVTAVFRSPEQGAWITAWLSRGDYGRWIVCSRLREDAVQCGQVWGTRDISGSNVVYAGPWEHRGRAGPTLSEETAFELARLMGRIDVPVDWRPSRLKREMIVRAIKHRCQQRLDERDLNGALLDAELM
jgi:hypothetical protein